MYGVVTPTRDMRRAKSQATMMYKIMNGLVDIPAADYVTPVQDQTIPRS